MEEATLTVLGPYEYLSSTEHKRRIMVFNNVLVIIFYAITMNLELSSFIKDAKEA